MIIPEFDPQLSQAQKQQLVTKYRHLLTLCRPFINKGDTKQLRQAFNIAFWASNDKKTALGDPGVYYAIDLTEILVAEAGLGITSIISSLLLPGYLEKKIEDAAVKSAFGDTVLAIMKGLAKIYSLRTGKTAIQSENFIRLLLTLSGDVRAVLIRMADSLYHMRLISYLPKPLQDKVATEAYFLYAPIAHRLGLYHIKTELEDLSMKFLHPDDYQLIINKIRETKKAREDYIEQFIAPVKKDLEHQGFRFEIKSRSKSAHSIWIKMKKQGVPFEEVFDLLAIRIILDCPVEKEKEECWRVYSIVTNYYPPNSSRLRDWISAPKASGYESLHTTVEGANQKWVEVQIRTQRMDEIAEKGHAAHWKYKESKIGPDNTGWLTRIRDLLVHPDSKSSLVAPDLESTDIFVFTPTGDLRRIAMGATVLDFAFDIHTDLGFQCTGARINGKIQPIKYQLQNCDEVEIITAKAQKPKSDWLNILKTSRAKSKVKRALKEEELKEAELGKETLMRKFKNWKIQFNDENILKVIKVLKFKTPIDLYHAISIEKVDLSKIKDIFYPPVKPDILSTPEDRIIKDEKKLQSTKDDFIFLDQNLAGINYTLASCCNPIFGDEVFGFVTISKGITIHRVNCPNAAEMKNKFDYRIMPVRWRESAASNSFQTTIKVSGIDTLGLLSTLSDVISNDMKVNMRSISIESNNGVFEGTIKLFVNDVKHLEMLLHRITRIKGVLKANRTD
ncbi:MAG: bifunctional (p)ppGpp synthetase/guanosine-3',5'-bis(diphosphate) 3'-pyrophosphohydrolase [Bacteroidales bacterium]